jgi:hypothetical protein
VLLVGSCFADEIGEKMVRGGFEALVNPFGTLYNPASIAASLMRAPLISPQGGKNHAASFPMTNNPNGNSSPLGEVERGLVFQGADGIWHSWMHHSSFSSSDVMTLVERMNSTTHRVADFLREADVLIVTFGTAIIYRLKETGMLVANCHKQPDTLFVRERLSAYDIVDQWQMLLQLLESVNPKLKIIFTVSPIRHKRDGYHVNQVSKGILLQSIDPLCSIEHLPLYGENRAGCYGAANKLDSSLHRGGDAQRAERVSYFPSYEIMMDELRDYRFYADDMIHPSAKAVEYIWQRFQDTYFDHRTRDVVAKAEKEWRQHQHRQIINSK